MVTVLGQSVDSGEVLEAVAFLEQYGLLTATGCAADWALAQPGGDREITVEELLDMVERGELADDAVVNVDGIPVTVADLKVMLEIEEYIAYLRETYFDGHQWTQEQLDNLEDLVNQINNEGIEFQGVEGEAPAEFQSDVTLSVNAPDVYEYDSGAYTATVFLNKPQSKDVTFTYTFYSGSLPVFETAAHEGDGLMVEARGTIPAGSTQTTISVYPYEPEVLQAGTSFMFLSVRDVVSAKLQGGGPEFFQTISSNIERETINVKHFTEREPGGEIPTDRFENNPESTSDGQVWVREGTYYPGQQIPIRIKSSPLAVRYDATNGDLGEGQPALNLDIVCYTAGNSEKKQTLSPLEKTYENGRAGCYLTYLYTVQEGDNGVLCFDSSKEIKFCCANDTTNLLPDFFLDPIDVDRFLWSLEVRTKSLNLPDDVGNVFAAATTERQPPKESAVLSLSADLLHDGEREALTKPAMEVSLILTDDKYFLNEENMNWLLSAAIENPDGQGFITDPQQLAFSLDGGETLYSFPIPSQSNGDPITDFTGVTLTTTIDLPLLNMPTARWDIDPGYPAAADVLREAVLYVDGNPIDRYADGGIQQGIRFIDGSWGGTNTPDFEADFEFVNTYTGQAWTEADYRNIEFTDIGVTLFEKMPWFTLSLPTLTVQNTELKFNISTANAKDTDKVPLSFGNTDSRTGFQLNGEGGYVGNENKYSCPYVPLDLNADFGIFSAMPATARVEENGEITYLAPGVNAFMVYATNGMVDDLDAMNDISGAVWGQDPYSYTSPSFFDLIPLPDFPAPTQEEWAQTCEALGIEGSMPTAPTSWDEFVSILSEQGESVSKPDGLIENWGDLAGALGVGEFFYISMGTEPFLSLPNPAMQATSGQDVTVYWSSNLCELNKAADTTFTVTVTKGNDTVYTATATGTKDAPASSVTIPANTLRYDYGAGASNQYTVTVSASYLGTEYTATGTIDLAAKPAKVTLKPLSSYYITDATKTVTIDWDLTDFGDTSGGQGANQQFELLITNGSDVVTTITDPGTAYGDDGVNYKGGYTLNVTDVKIDDSDPTSFRDVYTVTVKAMAGNNGTWSYDSFLLYVYDQNALDILIGGESVEGYKLSNRDTISKMSQEDILALNRDIQLKEFISTNYGERAWNALADQIIWKSDNSNVASINYPQGSYYDNIENYSYVSYRPTTDFGILGRDNGSTTFTATHKVTGISDSVPITVETLENKLYLFQFYPQAVTTIVYTNGNGKQTTMTSDANGAAAIYEESGITGNIYCSSKDAKGNEYRGTLYAETLKSGEGDWTRLEQYPCNNLNLRRTAYAYLYLKEPDGTPYTGTVSFRGGVYVNDNYVEEDSKGLFFLNGSETPVHGNEGVIVDLSKTNGKLTVEMDQTLWNSKVKNGDQVSYIFELISTKDGAEDTSYYPIFTVIDASANQNAFVSSGEAIVNFQENPAKNDVKHPFIATQIATLGSGVSNVMDYTGYVGINEDIQEGILSTAVMWWNDEGTAEHSLQLETSEKRKIADGTGEYTIETTTYPFTSHPVTNYTVRLNAETVGRLLDTGEATGVVLKYYTGGEMVRYEEMPYRLGNLRGAGKAEDSQSLLDEIQGMGNSMGTNGQAKEIDFNTDQYISMVLEFMADEDYTTEDPGAFRMQLAPTSDPTKFMGFISVSLGTLNDDEQVTGVYGNAKTGAADYDYTPGFRELMALAGEKTFYQWSDEVKNEFMSSKTKSGVKSIEWGVSGYMEALIYYDFDDYAWKARILSGGFSAGGGMSRSFFMNTLVGIVPITATLTVGGTAEVSMDALAVSYYNETKDVYGMGNDFLTELRLYLYLRFFAGIGFDYSVVAAKIGVFGQINLDMRFDWLNRPYMSSKSGDKIINVADKSTNQEKYNLDGQSFKGTGTAGLEVLLKLLFISYEKILYAQSWDLLNEKTGEWDTIQANWDLNSAANRAAVSGMMKNGSLEVYSAGGQQMLALNLAPTLEDRSYLENGGRIWGQGFSLFSLDPAGEQGLKNLESNTYPYANPVVTDDGQLVVYLHDNSSVNVEETVVKYATKSGTSYTQGGAIPAPSGSDEGDGYGDSQLSIGGTGTMAVAAWTRQMTGIEKVPLWVDEQGRPVYGQVGDQLIYSPTLTADEQMMMLNGTEIYASVYANGQWTTTRLTTNSTADMAPVVASNGKTAVVAWRSVAASDLENGGTLFNQRDSILYKVYDGTNWGETKTLYNGTSGAVKGIVADMMADGTAAVAYALDTDLNDSTTTDQEIAYAVIGTDGEVTRNVQATKDSYLDENPQLTSVEFDGQERFVLGWYTEQAVASDDAAVLDGGEDETSAETVSDIRLMEFGADGTTSQLLPDSMDQISSDYDVNITSNFRFTKNSETIDDLSILWVERAEEITAEDENTATLVERDVLKGVKFYTHGVDHQQISFTAAVDVAEMGDGTLIDHFDAYVSNAETNEIKAVILGTTYDANNPVTKVAETTDSKTVSVQVPSKVSTMYTATETYTDKIEVPTFLPDYDTVRLGAKTQLQFTVENRGIHAISKIDIQVGNQTTPHELATPLLPGDSIQLYADYEVPQDKVVDPTYKVTATFDEDTGATGSAETGGSAGYLFGLFGAEDGLNVVSGTVYLDLPDVEIVQAKVMNEENGQRTIQIGLSNHADAALANSGRSVRLSFYTDAACQTPVDEELLESIVISDNSDLAELDEGGYSTQITFDVGEFVKGEDGTVQEIPSGGVILYIKAEVLDKEKDSQGNPVVQGEPTAQDNYASVTCDNLKERTGKDVIIKSDISVEDGTATVTVDLQNTRLTETTTGNLLVIMLDASGEMVDYRQSYNSQAANKGLITLGGEGKATAQTFTFDNMAQSPNATFQVLYSDQFIDEGGEVNTELGSLFCEGLLANMDDVKWTQTADGNYEATVTNRGVSSTQVMAMAKSPDAKVSFSNVESKDNVACGTVALDVSGAGTITITVTSGDKSSTYTLHIQSGDTPPETVQVTGVSLNESSLTLTEGDTGTLIATVEPENATNQKVSWSSSDSTVATVENGTVTAVKEGTATITVTTEDGGKTAECKVTVEAGSTPTVPVESVSLNQTSMNLTAGSTGQLKATISPSNATSKGLNWTSSDPSVAKVDSDGTVTAVKAGTAIITVTTADGGKTAECKVTVESGSTPTVPVSSVSLNQTSMNLTAGSTGQLKATISPSNATSKGLNWTSSDPLVATVDGSGKVTAVKAGTATITVTTQDGGKTATCTVTVTADSGNSGSGSGGSPSYAVDTDARTDHGTVSVSPKQARSGQTVTITTKPDTGYEVGKVTVTRANGTTVAVTDKGNGVYTFTMPSSKVSVDVAFVPVDTACDGGADCPSRVFTDLSTTAWYHEAVDYVLRNGIMGGYGGGLFGPNDTLSRAQLCQILYNREGKPAVTGSSLFADVADTAWYANAVIWANANGIVGGYGGGLFGPNDPITREQLASILWRYAGSPASDHTLAGYTDADQVSIWAMDAMLWANENGILNGDGNGHLNPKGNATRAHVAQMIKNFIQKLEKCT